MESKKGFPKGTVILFALFITLLVIIFLVQSPANKTIPKDLIAVMRPYIIPLKPFTLVSHDEQPFTIEKLKDKWSFVFFGYTHCPDICPTTLTTIKQIKRTLKNNPKANADLQVIFVSIDPERDTPKSLEQYITYFNKEFIAVTGSAENLASFAKQFSAAYFKEKSNTPGDYLMSHASSIFLVNPKLELTSSFSPPHSVETIAEQYLKIHNLF